MSEKGFILIYTMLLLAGLILMGTFLMDHFLIESKINYNLYMEMKTYYIAQAGIEYATLKLESNPFWRTSGQDIYLADKGRILLKVIDDYDQIIVKSYGIYDEFQTLEQAYFGTGVPVQRVK
mgnify:CR=1 FL=1